MTTILLIRHGEISRQTPHRFVGSLDLPLTPQGREQMERLGRTLASRQIARVLCSPLDRARESADILCRSIGGTAEEVADFKEISLGAWEGLTVDEVKDRFPGCYEARGLNLPGFRPEAGESFTDLLLRVWPAFEKAAGLGHECLAIVAHAGVNQVLLSRILGLPLGQLFKLEQSYGCCNTLCGDDRGFRAQSINCLPS
ncbi:MAG TPA: histidine phosphatase family protein [Desulfopila sp.]|nr:histidine phosphatase family protein [Desulfopila sp.]